MALKTVFAFLNIGWSLGSEDVRDVDSISGRGANTIEVGSELGANGGISEVLFHHAELALSTVFPSVKFNLLALYCLEFILMCLIPVDISNNARVFEVNNGIVNEELGGRGWMEDVKVEC